MSQFEYGAIVLAIGMTVVMTALIGLALVMGLMKKVFYKEQKVNKTVAVAEKKVEEKPKVENKPKNNDAIIAAISAAIAAFTGQEELNFNIISVRKVGRSEWHEAGKQALLQSKISNKM